jgi:EAL domain-containing protein (putative c-di-GMP-specific phosphodiesterase class I)
LAENSGLIIPIGAWVLETACREATSWPDDIQISVNLSPVQFSQQDLIPRLTGVLDRCGLQPDRLILEVTEGLLLEETSTVLNTMSKLRAIGVRFSLDDFGTAHAGLSYLRRFPFDAIKIDKSFVQEMLDQPEARAIVAAVLGIGAALNLSVIAEGVETEAQLEQLRRMHCKQVQGYLTGRPRLPAAIREFIAKQR